MMNKDEILNLGTDELNEQIGLLVMGWTLGGNEEEDKEYRERGFGGKKRDYYYENETYTGYMKDDWVPDNITELQYVIDKATKKGIFFDIRLDGEGTSILYQDEVIITSNDLGEAVCKGILLIMLENHTEK